VGEERADYRSATTDLLIARANFGGEYHLSDFMPKFAGDDDAPPMADAMTDAEQAERVERAKMAMAVMRR